MNFLVKKDQAVVIRIKGYTLLELLIVVFIIGLVSSSVIIKVYDRPTVKEIDAFAELLKLRLKVVRQQAMSQSAVLGMIVKKNNYTFYQYMVKTHRWYPLEKIDSFWQTYPIPEGIQVSWQDRFIVILPSGDMTPFEMVIQGKNGLHPLQLSGNEFGVVFIKEVRHEN